MCRETLKNVKSKPAEPAPLPAEVDVVIIGGGVIGCSVLFHLAELGLNNVILLEKYQLTAGLLVASLQSHHFLMTCDCRKST